MFEPRSPPETYCSTSIPELHLALAATLPILAGVGGNGITQTMIVVAPAIGLEELYFSSARRALSKELSVHVCVAVVTGILLVLGALSWRGPFLGHVRTSANVINNGLVARFFEALTPLTLKSLHWDPSLGSTITSPRHLPMSADSSGCKV